MKSSNFWKYLNGNPTGVSLTTVMPHAESSGSAVIYPDGKVRIKVTAASGDKAASLRVYTPIAFRIVDLMVLYATEGGGGATQGLVLTVKNNTDTIAAVTSGSATYVKRPSTIDNSKCTFGVDDNDLYVIASCSSGGTAVVVLDTIFV